MVDGYDSSADYWKLVANESGVMELIYDGFEDIVDEEGNLLVSASGDTTEAWNALQAEMTELETLKNSPMSSQLADEIHQREVVVSRMRENYEASKTNAQNDGWMLDRAAARLTGATDVQFGVNPLRGNSSGTALLNVLEGTEIDGLSHNGGSWQWSEEGENIASVSPSLPGMSYDITNFYSSMTGFDKESILNEAFMQNTSGQAYVDIMRRSVLLSSQGEYDSLYKRFGKAEAFNELYTAMINPLENMVPGVEGSTANDISSRYGMRELENGKSEFHPGIDIRAGEDVAANAMLDGEIYKVYSDNLSKRVNNDSYYQSEEDSSLYWSRIYGNQVVLKPQFTFRDEQFDYGFVMLYNHLENVEVNNNTGFITQGTQMADIGSSGRSSGIHLDAEIRTGSTYGLPAYSDVLDIYFNSDCNEDYGSWLRWDPTPFIYSAWDDE